MTSEKKNCIECIYRHLCLDFQQCDMSDQQRLRVSKLNRTSLQCYSVLSTIAQVLRKISLKILASLFLMPYLSQTFG